MTRATPRIAPTLTALAVVLWTTGCDSEPVSPELQPTAASAALSVELPDPQRTALVDGIAHYTWDVDLGPGEFDRVRLHRVVMERRPHDPARTVDGIFLLPGSPNSWNQIFLPSSYSDAVPDDHAVAIYLAQHGIDVWGMDYAWGLIPDETADFGFMRDWGLQREIDFAYSALGTARSIRVASGQGHAPLHVLGFSYGAPLAYAIAGAETLLPPGRRMVKGLVVGELELFFEDPDQRAVSCDAAATKQAQVDQGAQYVTGSGQMLRLFGSLAAGDPQATSPFAPPLTNYQFALFVGAVNPGAPWHFVGGEFDSFGIPTDLRFTEPALWLDLMQQTPSYVPLQVQADLDWLRCQGPVDVEFDDHLGDITIPILDVDAAGGAGPGSYTASLTATADYQQLLVQLLPDAQAALDFGHADIFTASNADDLVWAPLLDWLMAHRENRRYP